MTTSQTLSNKMQNHYEILGVQREATDVEIKRSFRRLSLELHPDRSPGNESKYKQVVEAYSILGDNNKRTLYDLSLKENRLTKTNMSNNSSQQRNNYYSPSNTNIYNEWNDMHSNSYHEHDNFDNMQYNNLQNMSNPLRRFDNNTNGNAINIQPYSQSFQSYQTRQINNNQQHLEDIQQSVHITLEDAFTGVSVPITIERRVNGVSEEARVYVDIPQGTDDGEIIILEGKGHIDSNIRMRSHVRVKVVIDNHVIFRRDRLNIIYDLDITLKEALCGFRKEILHLDGRTYMIASEKGRIISQGGRRCITGKGFQRGQTMGNLIIVFNIVMPKSLTDEQIQRLAKILE
jgi:DnaJ family protein B protein 4